MAYNTGMLMGRAFALANGARPPHQRPDDPAAELCDLAGGAAAALQLAAAHYRELVAGGAPGVEDERALALLDAAVARAEHARRGTPPGQPVC